MKIILCVCLMFIGVQLSFGQDDGGSSDTNNSSVAESPQDQASKAEADYQKYIKDKAGDLKVEHDQFENQTVIKSNFGRGFGGGNELEFYKKKGEDAFDTVFIELKVQASIPDDKETAEQYKLIFSSFVQRPVFVNQNYWKPVVTDFHYTDCNDFHWLVDGKPLKYLNEKYANHLGNDETDSVETFTVILNKKQFETLAKASIVECKICDTQFVFNKKHFWVLRWVMEKANVLRSGTAPAPEK